MLLLACRCSPARPHAFLTLLAARASSLLCTALSGLLGRLWIADAAASLFPDAAHSLAMMAMIGFWAQAVSTGESPAVNLSKHLADPWHFNVGTNAVAFPL